MTTTTARATTTTAPAAWELEFVFDGESAWTQDVDHLPAIGDEIDGVRVTAVTITGRGSAAVNCEWA